MAGSPIKHERNRIVREAILNALKGKGEDPVVALEGMAKKIVEAAEAGDLAAFKEVADRLDGKPAQQVQLQGDSEQPLTVVVQKFGS